MVKKKTARKSMRTRAEISFLNNLTVTELLDASAAKHAVSKVTAASHDKDGAGTSVHPFPCKNIESTTLAASKNTKSTAPAELPTCKNTEYTSTAQLPTCKNTESTTPAQLPTCKNTESTSTAHLPSCKNTESTTPAQLPTCKNTESTSTAHLPCCKNTESTTPAQLPTCKNTESTSTAQLPSCKNTESTTPAQLPTSKNTESTTPAQLPTCKNTESTSTAQLPSCKNTESTTPAQLPTCKNTESTSTAQLPSCKNTESTSTAQLPACKNTESTSTAQVPTCKNTESTAPDQLPACKNTESTSTAQLPTCKNTESTSTAQLPSCKNIESTAPDQLPTSKNTKASKVGTPAQPSLSRKTESTAPHLPASRKTRSAEQGAIPCKLLPSRNTEFTAIKKHTRDQDSSCQKITSRATKECAAAQLASHGNTKPMLSSLKEESPSQISNGRVTDVKPHVVSSHSTKKRQSTHISPSVKPRTTSPSVKPSTDPSAKPSTDPSVKPRTTSPSVKPLGKSNLPNHKTISKAEISHEHKNVANVKPSDDFVFKQPYRVHLKDRYSLGVKRKSSSHGIKQEMTGKHIKQDPDNVTDKSVPSEDKARIKVEPGEGATGVTADNLASVSYKVSGVVVRVSSICDRRKSSSCAKPNLGSGKNTPQPQCHPDGRKVTSPDKIINRILPVFHPEEPNTDNIKCDSQAVQSSSKPKLNQQSQNSKTSPVDHNLNKILFESKSKNSVKCDQEVKTGGKLMVVGEKLQMENTVANINNINNKKSEKVKIPHVKPQHVLKDRSKGSDKHKEPESKDNNNGEKIIGSFVRSQPHASECPVNSHDKTAPKSRHRQRRWSIENFVVPSKEQQAASCRIRRERSHKDKVAIKDPWKNQQDAGAPRAKQVNLGISSKSRLIRRNDYVNERTRERLWPRTSGKLTVVNNRHSSTSHLKGSGTTAVLRSLRKSHSSTYTVQQPKTAAGTGSPNLKHCSVELVDVLKNPICPTKKNVKNSPSVKGSSSDCPDHLHPRVIVINNKIPGSSYGPALGPACSKKLAHPRTSSPIPIRRSITINNLPQHQEMGHCPPSIGVSTLTVEEGTTYIRENMETCSDPGLASDGHSPPPQHIERQQQVVTKPQPACVEPNLDVEHKVSEEKATVAQKEEASQKDFVDIEQKIGVAKIPDIEREVDMEQNPEIKDCPVNDKGPCADKSSRGSQSPGLPESTIQDRIVIPNQSSQKMDSDQKGSHSIQHAGDGIKKGSSSGSKRKSFRHKLIIHKRSLSAPAADTSCESRKRSLSKKESKREKKREKKRRSEGLSKEDFLKGKESEKLRTGESTRWKRKFQNAFRNLLTSRKHVSSAHEELIPKDSMQDAGRARESGLDIMVPVQSPTAHTADKSSCISAAASHQRLVCTEQSSSRSSQPFGQVSNTHVKKTIAPERTFGLQQESCGKISPSKCTYISPSSKQMPELEPSNTLWGASTMTPQTQMRKRCYSTSDMDSISMEPKLARKRLCGEFGTTVIIDKQSTMTAWHKRWRSEKCDASERPVMGSLSDGEQGAGHHAKDDSYGVVSRAASFKATKDMWQRKLVSASKTIHVTPPPSSTRELTAHGAESRPATQPEALVQVEAGDAEPVLTGDGHECAGPSHVDVFSPLKIIVEQEGCGKTLNADNPSDMHTSGSSTGSGSTVDIFTSDSNLYATLRQNLPTSASPDKHVSASDTPVIMVSIPLLESEEEAPQKKPIILEEAPQDEPPTLSEETAQDETPVQTQEEPLVLLQETPQEKPSIAWKVTHPETFSVLCEEAPQKDPPTWMVVGGRSEEVTASEETIQQKPRKEQPILLAVMPQEEEMPFQEAPKEKSHISLEVTPPVEPPQRPAPTDDPAIPLEEAPPEKEPLVLYLEDASQGKTVVVENATLQEPSTPLETTAQTSSPRKLVPESEPMNPPIIKTPQKVKSIKMKRVSVISSSSESDFMSDSTGNKILSPAHWVVVGGRSEEVTACEYMNTLLQHKGQAYCGEQRDLLTQPRGESCVQADGGTQIELEQQTLNSPKKENAEGCAMTTVAASVQSSTQKEQSIASAATLPSSTENLVPIATNVPVVSAFDQENQDPQASHGRGRGNDGGPQRREGVHIGGRGTGDARGFQGPSVVRPSQSTFPVFYEQSQWNNASSRPHVATTTLPPGHAIHQLPPPLIRITPDNMGLLPVEHNPVKQCTGSPWSRGASSSLSANVRAPSPPGWAAATETTSTLKLPNHPRNPKHFHLPAPSQASTPQPWIHFPETGSPQLQQLPSILDMSTATVGWENTVGSSVSSQGVDSSSNLGPQLSRILHNSGMQAVDPSAQGPADPNTSDQVAPEETLAHAGKLWNLSSMLQKRAFTLLHQHIGCISAQKKSVVEQLAAERWQRQQLQLELQLLKQSQQPGPTQPQSYSSNFTL